MKNIDISRDSFDPRKNFSRVLLQQGRVQVDADWNEQTAIVMRHLRLMMQDMFGPHAGPESDCGFVVITKGDHLPDGGSDEDRHRIKQLLSDCEPGDFVLIGGRYYVDGLLCENHEPIRYSHQAVEEHCHHGVDEAGRYLVFLDVWEREVTALEDDSIREIALGGPDSAARMQLAWKVRVVPLQKAASVNETFRSMRPPWHEHVASWQSRHRGRLKARAREDGDADEFEAEDVHGSYRGPENQLYRIEIHRGGSCSDATHPTFKWSRDNGIVALPVEQVASDGSAVTLHRWGPDETWAIRAGDWVELIEVTARQPEQHGSMHQVVDVDIANRVVRFSAKAPLDESRQAGATTHILRRWDQKLGNVRKGAPELDGGAVALVEDRWIAIEDGIEVLFERSASHSYRAGDYWLVPARATSGDVLLPRNGQEPLSRPPAGVDHHFAPLAIVDVDASQTNVVADLTRRFGFKKSDQVTGELMTRG